VNAQEIRELLPWYAAGSLDAGQMRAVEAALQNDPQLERELKEFRALHTNVRRVSDAEPAFRPTLLDEAHQRIDAYERTRKSAKDQNFFAAMNASIANALEKLFGAWTGMPTYARIAVAGQFAVIAVLGVLLMMQQRIEVVSHTAGGSNEALLAHADMIVAFQPQASAEQIEQLLSGIDAHFVSGPTAQQSYGIALSESKATSIDRALATLRKQTDVVRLANRAE
jgi:anti-sigma factor RsiW